MSDGLRGSAPWLARKLVRAARMASLATVADGQPFVSLVSPATAPDLSVLLLLSELSAHTRHLRAEPRCSVLFCGAPETVNPQSTPRVSVTGHAAPLADPALLARYLAVHPYAALYAGFTDFSLWRLCPAGALYVGGFGRAARLRAAALAPDPAAVAAIEAAEAELIAWVNAVEAPALARLAGRPGGWRMVALDVDGCDLAQAETVLRVPFPAPLTGAAAFRAAFARPAG